MPIKSIKMGGDIPSNQVGVATNPRAENSLSELSFEGHPRPLNSNVYTNKLNNPSTGTLVYKTYPVQPFTSLIEDFESVSVYQDEGEFTDVRIKGDFIFVGVQYYNSGSTSLSSSTKVSVGRVYIYKLDGTHWATIPSPAPLERSYYRFGASLDYDPSVGKIYVGAVDSSQTTGGILHIYDWDESQKFTTSDWGTPTIVQASDRVASQIDFFGWIVRAAGGYVAVSATQGGPNGYGKVYVYDSNGSNEVAITPSGYYYTVTHVNFGCSLDIDGNSTDGYKIVVGAHDWDDTGGSTRNGGAFIYNVDGTGEVKILPANPTAHRTYNWGHGVAIDVSAGKVIITCPESTDTAIGYTNGQDVGVIASFNLDGTGQTNITPIYPATPNPLPTSIWPAQTFFGKKIGINRNTQRIFVYQDNTGPDGLRFGVSIFDYNGDNPVARILYQTPGQTPAPDPTGLYPFGKETNSVPNPGQATPHKDDPTWDGDPVEDLFNNDVYEPSQGPNASKRWCVTDTGALCVIGTAVVYSPEFSTGYENQGFGVGYLIKGLDS